MPHVVQIIELPHPHGERGSGGGGQLSKKRARLAQEGGREGEKAQMEWWQNGESLLRFGGKEGTSSRDIDFPERQALLLKKLLPTVLRE